MNKFELYKQALGPLARSLSDEEIRKLMTLHELMAQTLFDMWLKHLNRK